MKTHHNKLFIAGILLCLSALLPGCVRNTAAVSPTSSQIQVNEDFNKPLEINEGETFSIMLSANPTTGYQWTLKNPLDPTKLKLMHSQYQATATAVHIVGSGGKETWTFKALHKGNATITLQYHRPWEKEKPPARIKEYQVIIKSEKRKTGEKGNILFHRFFI
jgi:inhibitor of cysteine peptidase